MQVIRSRHNPLVKSIRALHESKRRRREGRFLIEGVRLLEEAVAAGVHLERVLFAPELVTAERERALLERLKASGVTLNAVTASVLTAVAETETPQGFVAVAHVPPPPDVWALVRRGNLLVLGDGIQDPGNAGTIIRTAAAAGAQGVFFSPGSVDPYAGKVVRASMGSLFRLAVAVLGDSRELVNACRSAGWEVLVTSPAGGIPPWQVRMEGPLLVILGNEGAGVSSELLAAGTQRVYIPLADTVESLNVAVAGGVILFEAVRQRQGKNRGAVPGA
ncbi:MAG: methyltransferase, TrmH family [Bacillota bacterium]|nr:methyltransferase, TrmH family [Bacillota bacterium]MDK2960824.1 methyltransferase, TrmH family [Bacillota bacterium]